MTKFDFCVWWILMAEHDRRERRRKERAQIYTALYALKRKGIIEIPERGRYQIKSKP